MFNFHPKSLAPTILTGNDRVNDLIGFRFTLLDNLPLLRNRADNISLTISQAEADQFYGDFYGLLGFLKAPIELFWIITQINNLTCSTDYDSTLLEIVIPAQSEINRIKTIYLSTNN